MQSPLISKGADVTPEIIQKALQGDPVISDQNFVSLPAVQRYVDRLLKGYIAPPIKMDGNVIVDGNHCYIAAKIYCYMMMCGQEREATMSYLRLLQV